MIRPATVIKIKRLTQGLRVKDLATKIGYSVSTLTMMERGAITASAKLQDAIASYFKCERGELFNDDGYALRSA